jgi:tRNA(Ile)-lysidine synthase
VLNDGGRPEPGRIFSGFDLAARRSVIVAVSGGSDSLALLLLLKDHLDQVAPGVVKPVAVTVDHGLRAGSGEEAAMVGALCAARGIEHRTLQWKGEKPATGLSAASREARYRLLAQAASDAGTDVVLTGHTLDDQTETVLMRRARGAGRGLAGMAPATLYDWRVWIARPLLGTGRDPLRALLLDHAISWIDDPSNEKPEFERVRARAAIAAADDPGALKRKLIETAQRSAAERVELGRRAAGLINAEVGLVAPGLCRLRHGHGRLAQPGLQDLDARIYALRILLACAGGAEQLPDKKRAALLMREFSTERLRCAFSGAVVDIRSGAIHLHREFRGEGPPPAALRDGAIWDGRFRILAGRDADPGLFVAPLGKERAGSAAIEDGRAPPGLVRAALACAPALWRGEECLGVLSGNECRHGAAAVPVVAPWARFLPSFDLAPARAAAALIGARPCSAPPPFAGHEPA